MSDSLVTSPIDVPGHVDRPFGTLRARGGHDRCGDAGVESGGLLHVRIPIADLSKQRSALQVAGLTLEPVCTNQKHTRQ